MKRLWILLILIVISGTAQASAETSVFSFSREPNETTLFIGSSYEYMEAGNYGNFIHFRDSYNHRVELWLIKKGEIVDRAICSKREQYCILGNTKLKLKNVFYGREFVAIVFKIIKIYEGGATQT